MRLSRVLLFALIALACHGLAAAKPVVIRFQYWGGLEEIPSIERIVRDFNAAHPNIRVVAQRAPGGGNGPEPRPLRRPLGIDFACSSR